MQKRMVRFNRLTVAVLAVLAAIAGFVIFFSRAATPSSNPNSLGRFGMNTLAVMSGNNTQVGTVFDNLKAADVNWIRGDFEWSVVQQNGKNSFDWSREDVMVAQAVSHHINVLATLDYTPAWARTNQSSDKYPPDNVADYAAYVSAAVTRYKASVHYWELWNEPNNATFWQPSPNVAAYTALLKAGYAAAKAADPTATVISAGLSPGSGTSDPRTFLQGMYDNNGGTSTGLFDAVGWHPYCDAINPVTSTDEWCSWYRMSGTTPSARSIMTAAGDSNKLIWPTEYGVCTNGTGGATGSEATQAADLTAAYNGAGQTSWLGPLFWYEFQDVSTDTSSNFFNFCGLLNFNGTKKQSWTAFQSLAAQDTSGPVTGDVNGDGKVNILDLSVLASHYGATGATLAQGDVNGDGVVNISDLSIIAAHWTG